MCIVSVSDILRTFQNELILTVTNKTMTKEGRSSPRYLMTLLHVQAFAPVRKGLLLQFSSRCCPSRTKDLSFSPGSGHQG